MNDKITGKVDVAIKARDEEGQRKLDDLESRIEAEVMSGDLEARAKFLLEAASIVDDIADDGVVSIQVQLGADVLKAMLMAAATSDAPRPGFIKSIIKAEED